LWREVVTDRELRELDARVAEKVIGITPLLVEDELHVFTVNRRFLQPGDYYYLDTDNSRIEVPHYSTDIAAAWQVIEKMYEYGCHIVSIAAVREWRAKYECVIGAIGNVHTEINVDADTAPMAICLAALKVIGLLHSNHE
jgi:hypothetical protein